MEKPKPMDHLLCGDVGFGKTEVAMRCAFKAVSNNKQVAFLCPTTILSMQHYQTLKKRFENVGVNIALVNRFVENSRIKDIQKVWQLVRSTLLSELINCLIKTLNIKIWAF